MLRHHVRGHASTQFAIVLSNAVCGIDRSPDVERLAVSKHVHNWTGRVRVGHG